MFALIAGLVAAIPTFDKWFTAIVEEYQKIQAAKVEDQSDGAFAPLENPNQKATDAQKQASMAALDNVSAHE